MLWCCFIWMLCCFLLMLFHIDCQTTSTILKQININPGLLSYFFVDVVYWLCESQFLIWGFLSLYIPWGLDSRKPASISQPRSASASHGSWKAWRNETMDSPALIHAWKSRVITWLDDELAAGVEHGILDLMFFGGNPQRGAFKEEVGENEPGSRVKAPN